MAEQAKTAKKTTAKRKPAARKPAKRKPVAKKTVARKPAAKKTAKKASAKSTPDFSSRAQEMGRNAFLASLGFYGKAFDQAQDQFDSLQDQLEARRKKADKAYKELVKRGKKVEKQAKNAIDDIDLPKLEIESLTDRKQLEAQLKKAKARFEELRDTVGLKAA